MMDGCERYGVRVARAAGSGVVWRVVGCDHLSGAENGGRHVVEVRLLDASGAWYMPRGDERIRLSWEGMREEETPWPVRPEKAEGEGRHGDVMLGRGMRARVWVEETGAWSDVVEGLSADHPDEEEGNTFGHHSFRVAFRRVDAPEPLVNVAPVVRDVSPWRPAVRAEDHTEAIRELQGNVQALFREVDRLSALR